MDFASIAQFLVAFSTPVPAMLMYFWNTKKLNFLLPITIVCSIFFPLFLYYFDSTFLSFPPYLLMNYAFMLSAGLIFFSEKQHNFPQAFSLAFSTLFINIFFWETPIYLYIFSMTGQYAWYSQLAPLALFVASFFLVSWSKKEPPLIQINKRKTAKWFLLGLFISTLFLLPIMINGWIIWVSDTITPNLNANLMNTLWFFNRVLCYFTLLKAFTTTKS